ncbi:hypothetical protein [Succinivibrio dextrinosolvens]|uniref:hypothetical protein n=1 Tax=Succinivibrio dextrinosolvens TaxID=83771 RepID=UPI001923E35F|nr:hypothetical protein [Succinivibrio dextrinosolvens]
MIDPIKALDYSNKLFTAGATALVSADILLEKFGKLKQTKQTYWNNNDDTKHQRIEWSKYLTKKQKKALKKKQKKALKKLINKKVSKKLKKLMLNKSHNIHGYLN